MSANRKHAKRQTVTTKTSGSAPGTMRILIVCLGNICRSPTAEVVLRDAVANAGLADRVMIDSAGTGDWHVGNPPEPRAVAHAARRGYDLTALRARQVSPADFDRFDWILAMDASVLDALVALRPPAFEGRLTLFLDARDVPDPYAAGPEGFERALDLIERGSAALVAKLAQGQSGPRTSHG